MSAEIRITGETFVDAMQQMFDYCAQRQNIIEQVQPSRLSAPMGGGIALTTQEQANVQPQATVTQQPTRGVNAPGPVPTAAPTYNLQDIARAGADLATASPEKTQELTNLLNRYGVQAVTQLPQEHWGAFAAELRGLGAKI